MRRWNQFLNTINICNLIFAWDETFNFTTECETRQEQKYIFIDSLIDTMNSRLLIFLLGVLWYIVLLYIWSCIIKRFKAMNHGMILMLHEIPTHAEYFNK